MKKVLLGVLILAYVFFIYRTQMYTIETPSMEPTFKEGSVVLVDKKYHYDRVKVGDIIAYNNSYKIIIHRVMQIDSDGTILTRGDANTQMDGSHATRQNYLGKYICNFTVLGKFIIFLRSPGGLVAIIVVVVVISLLKKPFRKAKRMIKNAL